MRTDDSGAIRVYDAAAPEDIVTLLYENGVSVSEIARDKIGLEEYYIDLTHQAQRRERRTA